MTISIGPIGPERAAEFRDVMAHAFGFDATPEGLDRFRPIFEAERSRCALDGDTVVGTLGAFSLDLTIPGTSIPCGGTTAVSVLPSHRRRGLLRQMMAAHLQDVAEHGEAIAALWASESSIYGRFGFGVAARGVDLSIPRSHVGFHRLAASGLRARIIEKDEAVKLLPQIHDRIRLDYPGFFARWQAWWDQRWFADPKDLRNGYTPLRFAVVDDDSGPAGFAQYRQKFAWEEGHGNGKLEVHDLYGTSPESWAALWQLMLEHDLVARITAPLRSIDDPIFDLLEAGRRAQAELSADTLWVRIVDLEGALAARAYQGSGRVTLEVADPFRERTDVVTLVVEDGKPHVERERRRVDVSVDIEDLSGAYLGWSRFLNLAKSGRAKGDERALVEADRLFGWPVTPWCPEIF
ncbi:MAG TPA: GNAT family N-acetyltransferase [Acidimicrobiia bacterium]|jgi:predicted acetyltransferase